MTVHTCAVPDCDRDRVAKGYCGAHYQKWSRTGDPLTPNRRPQVGPAVCTLSDCSEPYYGKGMCEKHYARVRRSGSPDLATEEERFWGYVNADGVCWEWMGLRNNYGYGMAWSPSKANTRSNKMPAHRWAWETLVGPIPEGLHIDHLCRNRACVNPDHLEPVTPAENVRRGASALPRRVNA